MSDYGYRNNDSKGSIVLDVDGNQYPIIVIGRQSWLSVNLKVTHYRDGSPIKNLEDESWSNTREGAYCQVERHPKVSEERYGYLYNFYAVDNPLGLCPEGWHIPSIEEWNELITYLGGTELAGAKMRDIDSGQWKIQLNNSSNAVGFSALPAGGRGRLGRSRDLGFYATWWSCTSLDELFAWHYGLFPDKVGIRFNPGHKCSGFSVRCIKD